MDLLAVDYGGTRTKVGRFIRGGLVEVNVFPSPDKWSDMLEQVTKYYSGEEIGFALQGFVPLFNRGAWQYGPIPRPKNKQVNFDLFKSELLRRGFKYPRLITSDTTAQAFGVVGYQSGLVCQLSTGIALKIIDCGKLCLDHDKSPLFVKFSQDEKYKIMNQEKSFYHWLRSEFLRKWIDPSLSHLSWQEMAKSGHNDLEYIVDIFTNFVLRAYRQSPINNPDIYLVGGGALALKEHLKKEFKDLGISVQFANDSEATPLKGINHLAENGLSCKVFN